LAQDQQKMKDIIEIYYICLALGFEGKYRITGNYAERDIIIDKLARLLLKFGKHTYSGLSPHGKRAVSMRLPRQSFRLIPLWLISTISTLLLIGWWFAAHYVVKESLQQVLSVIL
jgi:type VI secretion system protein ImpK